MTTKVHLLRRFYLERKKSIKSIIAANVDGNELGDLLIVDKKGKVSLIADVIANSKSIHYANLPKSKKGQYGVALAGGKVIGLTVLSGGSAKKKRSKKKRKKKSKKKARASALSIVSLSANSLGTVQMSRGSKVISLDYHPTEPRFAVLKGKKITLVDHAGNALATFSTAKKATLLALDVFGLGYLQIVSASNNTATIIDPKTGTEIHSVSINTKDRVDNDNSGGDDGLPIDGSGECAGVLDRINDLFAQGRFDEASQLISKLGSKCFSRSVFGAIPGDLFDTNLPGSIFGDLTGAFAPGGSSPKKEKAQEEKRIYY